MTELIDYASHIDDRVRKLIDSWPELTSEQCENLARLLGPHWGGDVT